MESNHFRTDEFIECCRKLDAEPYITVSLGTGSLDEALHWLEYCNLDTPTKYAQMRRDFEHPRPYGELSIGGLGMKFVTLGKVSDFAAEKGAVVFELGAEDPFVKNDFESPDLVKVKERREELLTNRRFDGIF